MSTVSRVAAWRSPYSNSLYLAMMFEEEDFFNHESLLVITEKGVLKRLKTPFKVFLITGVNQLKGQEFYLVDAVITNAQQVMVYAIDGQSYCYYWFIVIG